MPLCTGHTGDNGDSNAADYEDDGDVKCRAC